MVRSPIFEMAPSFCLPPVDFCSGVSPGQAAKSRPARKPCGAGTRADRHEPARDGVVLRAPADLRIEVVDLLPECLAGVDEHLQDAPCSLRHGRLRVLDHGNQPIDVVDPLRDDMTMFGQMPAKGVDALRPLPHQQVAGPEHEGVRLLRCGLHRHEAHARPLRRLADRLGVGRVVLLPLDEGLDVGRRDQPYRMTRPAKLACPVVRSATRLDRHDARRLPREELEHLGPRQPLAEHHTPGRVGAVGLEYVLRDVQPDRASLSHGRLPWWSLNTSTLAHRCRRGASTPSRCGG
jgi:hypothetical protein